MFITQPKQFQFYVNNSLFILLYLGYDCKNL